MTPEVRAWLHDLRRHDRASAIQVGQAIGLLIEAGPELGRPLADLVGPMPYAVRQTLLDEPNARNGLHRYWLSAFAGQLSGQFLDVAVEAASSFI